MKKNILATPIAAAASVLPGLTVPRVDWGDLPSIERVDALLESGNFELHRVDRVNWPEEFPDKPEVGFRIAHSGAEIYIKYYVAEDAVRAVFDADNGRPWTDSCVEFFIRPGDEGDETFYNLEMSCIGYGILNGRPPGEPSIPMDGLGRVRRLTSMPREAFGTREGRRSWTLTLAIPVDVFVLTPVPLLGGRTVRANFYKCGDELPRAHFLSWSPIDTPSPNFHQPGFFGYLHFE